jgi:hypothetical protein
MINHVVTDCSVAFAQESGVKIKRRSHSAPGSRPDASVPMFNCPPAAGREPVPVATVPPFRHTAKSEALNRAATLAVVRAVMVFATVAITDDPPDTTFNCGVLAPDVVARISARLFMLPSLKLAMALAADAVELVRNSAYRLPPTAGSYHPVVGT